MKNHLLIFSFFLLLVMNAQAQNPKGNWTQKNAAKWFDSHDWAGGLALQADKSVDKVEFARQYHKNKPYWDLAFKWMKEHDLSTVATGKYVLDSMNVTVNVTEGPSTMAFEKTRWEGHGKYIDIQYIASGKEKMGIAPMAGSKIQIPYNASRDVGFYLVDEAKAKYVVAEPGKFLIFFPSDAHRPNIKVEGSETVKKVVFKIKADTNEDFDGRQENENKKLKIQQQL